LDDLIAKTLESDEQKFKLFKEQTNELFAKVEDEQGIREVCLLYVSID
jgi:hypothetical protein